MKGRILAKLEVVEEFITSFFFIVGSIICLFGIFMRYVMNHPIIWTNELFEIFMVTAIFIGFGIALKENHHIKVDLVYEKLPPFMKRVVDIVSNLLGAGFSIFLAVMGVEMVNVAREQGGVSIDLGIPHWITYLAMPVGMGLLGLYFIVKTFNAIRGKDLDVENSNDDVQNIF
ncbi:TRAP transporter small permease [Sporosarcina sp. SAFN-015]|uniref:TRAP transporter small permease n=1 Tax=Sporosarcina sp. SAFN-015 TaxID=3387274 RepID=UPI003F800917